MCKVVMMKLIWTDGRTFALLILTLLVAVVSQEDMEDMGREDIAALPPTLHSPASTFGKLESLIVGIASNLTQKTNVSNAWRRHVSSVEAPLPTIDPGSVHRLRLRGSSSKLSSIRQPESWRR